MRFRFALSAMLCAAFSASCVDGTGPSGPKSITGVVTMNGVPQAGVSVSLAHGAQFATTGGDGSFTFENVPAGQYQVTPNLAGHAFRPASRVVTLGGANLTGADFAAEVGTTHSITGTVAGGGAVVLNLTGDNTGAVMVQENGSFHFPNLRVGTYVVTPSTATANFVPAADTVLGVFDFEHNQTGNGVLGAVSLTSAVWGTQDALGSFEPLPLNPPDAVGSMRPLRTAEVQPSALATHNAMWTALGTVTFTYATSLGPMTWTLQLGPNGTFVAASTTGFLLTERLVGGSGLSFTAVTP